MGKNFVPRWDKVKTKILRLIGSLGNSLLLGLVTLSKRSHSNRLTD